jgi:hypothetical protein
MPPLILAWKVRVFAAVHGLHAQIDPIAAIAQA